MTTRSDAAPPTSFAEARGILEAVAGNVGQVIVGKQAQVRLALIALIAEGHVLIEDVPGVGKTLLAKSLARSIHGTMRRIQFTPDLLPGDVTGISVFDQRTAAFTFRTGAVFANVVLADEINRASPKTQSALLESMEEAQVTVDGTTHLLPRPFIVIATQNPIEMEGTYPLPEAQRDRFMMQLSLGYPERAAELAMLDAHESGEALEQLRAVTDATAIEQMQKAVRTVFAAPEVKQYVVDIVAATRTSPMLQLGASPRASVHLLQASKALALANGRDHVLPDDVRFLAPAVLAHRLLLSADARIERRRASDIVVDLLAHVVPG